MMTYDQFCESIKNDILNYLPEEYMNADVVIESVKKNNGHVYEGVSVRIPGESAAPILYLNNYYEEYLDGVFYPEIIEKIANKLADARVDESVFSTQQLKDYEYVSKRLILNVCNYEKNRDYLKEVPHVVKGDYALTVRCEVARDENGSAAFTIKNSHLKMYGISKEKLFEDVYQSAPQMEPPEFKSMREVIQAMLPFGDELPEEEPGELGMYVLTNRSKRNGAACMFYPGTMETISRQFKSDLHIIPSSIHEVIILTEEQDSERIGEMIREVNETQVDPEEILGIRPSTYDAIQKEIIPMCEYEKHIKMIKNDIVSMGYMPAEAIINGIRKVEKLTGQNCQLKDMASIAKSCGPKTDSELKETLNLIGKQLQLQDMQFPKL